MKVCSPCAEDSHFRFTVSPHESFDLSLTLKNGAGDVLLVSEEGGKGVEKTVAMLLKQGESYSVDIWYDNEAVECSAVFIELALKEGSIAESDCTQGISPTDDNNRPINFNLTGYSDPYYSFETSMAHSRPTISGRTPDFDRFTVVAPFRPGHDGQWRFRLDLRTEFISGGDFTAVVSNKEKMPDLKDCNQGSTECIFGARGRWKNTYSIDMTIRSLTTWYVHFFRRRRDTDMDRDEETPPCVKYWFKAQLRAETLEENFISCDALPLPENLNMPGFYDERTGEMALDMELLLSTVSTSQSARIKPVADSLFKLTISHEEIDVDVQLYKGSELIANSEDIMKPEGITAQLRGGTEYSIAVIHNFDYVVFEDGWKPNCNKAMLRMEVAKQTSTIDICDDSNNLPELNFTDGHFVSTFNEFGYNYQPPMDKQETISAWEFELQWERLFQVIIPHNYVNGEVAASLIKLHRTNVQLTQLAFITDEGVELNEETAKNRNMELKVTNPGGDNPKKERPENVASSNKNSKWLDYNIMPLVFDFGSKVTIEKFKLVTGNDYENRDPVQWVIYGSETGEWDSSNSSKNGKVIYRQDTDYDMPVLRRTPTADIPFSEPQTYRYFIFEVTATRDYQEHKDVTYADSDMEGTYLSKILPSGRYRFSLLTGWGNVYPATDNDHIPKCVRFGMDILIEDSMCNLKRLPTYLGLIHSRKYLFGEYRVPVTKVHTIHFSVEQRSMLNLDIVNGAVNVTSIILQTKDGQVSSEDYYNNGLHWMMSKLEKGENYTLTFNFGGDVKHCDNMNLQISIMELPSNQGSSEASPDIDTLELNSGNGYVILPFAHNAVYQYGADKHEHHHHLFMLKEAAEIRVLIHFNFEFLHVYVDICECQTSAYAECHDCGKGRGYSIFNGNHLEAQTLPAGYYVMKFYETTFSEDSTNRVSYYNKFEVTISMVALDKQTEDQTMCGHQPLPTHLNGPGMLSETSLEPNTMHTIAEVLVPDPVVGGQPARSSSTRFNVHTLSIFRLWVPLKEGLSVSARLTKLASDEGVHEDPWPTGSSPGNYGIVMNPGEAIFHVLPDGYYKLTLTFDTELSLDCLTYDVELSVTPMSSPKVAAFNASCPKDSPFPAEMTASGHDFSYRSLPDTGDNGEPSGHRFRHIIPFEVKSVLGGRVDVDLVSTFESGGLTAHVRDAESKAIVLYPIRYLHRDYLQQDLTQGSYELVVQDMASQAQNVEFVKLSGQSNMCNRFSIHVRYDDYTEDTDKCTLSVTDKVPSDAISTFDTVKKLVFYNNVRFPQETRQMEFNFQVEKMGTVFKVWAYSRSSATFTASVIRSGMEVASGCVNPIVF
eukprot:TRINITY_DN7873_c0_g1_i2.p1 TRINITY_DN7873_c0_g1~~TRINITY_DN7873_c0_g1_i2.p1  ORF type:complete len:1426 (+),score=598.92 TRINITY_DN7873_c0_g1_i2:268-4278(+)